LQQSGLCGWKDKPLQTPRIKDFIPYVSGIFSPAGSRLRLSKQDTLIGILRKKTLKSMDSWEWQMNPQQAEEKINGLIEDM
jgi:hypothetical protein